MATRQLECPRCKRLVDPPLAAFDPFWMKAGTICSSCNGRLAPPRNAQLLGNAARVVTLLAIYWLAFRLFGLSLVPLVGALLLALVASNLVSRTVCRSLTKTLVDVDPYP